ncbi:MAG: tripartite tricarboxylate transporter permease [Enterocloster asparagiformis]|nr:tripartite tricarboxylate transporter permease [Enterocloster asparagiformis]
MNFNTILEAFWTSVTLANIGMLFLGTFLGIVVGALPGLGPTIGVALLIPISYGMETSTALILMAGIYTGAVYGGSITAILLGIPGTPNSAATVLDGFEMAKQGKSMDALGASTVASGFGGLTAALCMMFFTPLVSRIVLYFGVAEQFMLAIFGLSVIAIASKENFLKGLLGGFFGLAIATIGYDPITGLDRFTFGTTLLADGIDFMVVVMGLFGIAQTFSLAEEARSISATPKLSGSVRNGAVSVLRHWKVTIRATGIGLFFGAVPGVGGGAANMIAYTSAAAASEDRESFGCGNIRGVIAPEAANNATVGSALIPTLAFGIPGSAVCAIVMGLLTMHGIDVGPKLFTKLPPELYVFFWGMLLTNFALVIIALPLMRYFAKVTLVPYQILVPNIIILCGLGTYSLRGSFFDVFMTIAFGILGYFLKKANFPTVTIVLGLVLGSLAEANLSRSLLIYKGWRFLYTRPIVLALVIITCLIIVLPYIDFKKWKKEK